jgi:two-component system OmpR family response regulator
VSPEPSVLLVEDEENVAYVAALALRHSGFEVRVVATGAEALRLSSEAPMPDIVVLDVMLPDLDGFEVCRRMRADQNDLPVLFSPPGTLPPTVFTASPSAGTTT